ncbi:Predicted dehydrogenase [Arachidicoccus rhizosphaerae]|jgi:predicted dehydrogenase|uniref:Predicted dehydrogenase n=1 Tax=Arachidicoccus rhizosphaerae TaxID=551991 RepID=A0A1H3ZFE2_9BACT|nr:Gfo/Idh/MocA family oxidoreductase [Arachidicoccus rhizosphaerae]SEA22513.1 Predicted dehydrogenase [Arachidicoccus rhizosphaerae]
MQEKIYNWGILGPGKIAKKFAEALQHPTVSRRCKLYGVASRDLERAVDFAETFKAEKAYGGYEQLIQDPEVDIIYIATPHAFHFELAMACILNHKHVLVEKPMSLNREQTHFLVEKAIEHNTFLMEALWTRFLPMTESILDDIKHNKLGDIRFIKSDFGFPAPNVPSGRLFNPRLGGGSILDVGIYPLFLCLLILGDFTEAVITGTLSDQHIDLNCQAVLKYKNGATALIASAIDTQLPITTEITGTKGQIRIPCPWYKNDHYYLKTTQNDHSEKVQLPAHTNGFEYEILEVIDCLDKGLIHSAKWETAASMILAEQMDRLLEKLAVKHPYTCHPFSDRLNTPPRI